MLIERYNIKNSNSTVSSSNQINNSVLPDELFDLLKDYYVVVEENIVYREDSSDNAFE